MLTLLVENEERNPKETSFECDYTAEVIHTFSGLPTVISIEETGNTEAPYVTELVEAQETDSGLRLMDQEVGEEE